MSPCYKKFNLFNLSEWLIYKITCLTHLLAIYLQRNVKWMHKWAMASKGVKITQAVILTTPKYKYKNIFYVRVDTETTEKQRLGNHISTSQTQMSKWADRLSTGFTDSVLMSMLSKKYLLLPQFFGHVWILHQLRLVLLCLDMLWTVYIDRYFVRLLVSAVRVLFVVVASVDDPHVEAQTAHEGTLWTDHVFAAPLGLAVDLQMVNTSSLKFISKSANSSLSSPSLLTDRTMKSSLLIDLRLSISVKHIPILFSQHFSSSPVLRIQREKYCTEKKPVGVSFDVNNRIQFSLISQLLYLFTVHPWLATCPRIHILETARWTNRYILSVPVKLLHISSLGLCQKLYRKF